MIEVKALINSIADIVHYEGHRASSAQKWEEKFKGNNSILVVSHDTITVGGGRGGEIYEGGDKIEINRQDLNGSYNPWEVKVSDLSALVPSFQNPECINISFDQKKKRGIVYSFVFKSKVSGHISYTNGHLSLSSVKDVDLLYEEMKNLESIFPL